MMPFILIQSLPVVLLIVLTRRIDILHCRSYPVAWAASIVKSVVPVRMVFDPRSDFPEENIAAGNWSAMSTTHKAWKRLEKRLLEQADTTIAITDSYIEHFSKVAPEAEFRLVPNNVDTKRFSRDAGFREAFRNSHGLNRDAIVFCYNGSMGDHWNSPVPYADFIIRLRDLDMAHWFLFITTGGPAVRRTLEARGVRPEEYGIVSCAFDDVPKYLSVADMGTMFVREFRIALGIKSVEYLAAGLPMIVNDKAAGAAEVVTRHQAGLVVPEVGTADLDAIRALARDKEEMFRTCRHLAETRFSTPTVAGRYLQIYDSLAS